MGRPGVGEEIAQTPCAFESTRRFLLAERLKELPGTKDHSPRNNLFPAREVPLEREKMNLDGRISYVDNTLRSREVASSGSQGSLAPLGGDFDLRFSVEHGSVRGCWFSGAAR